MPILARADEGTVQKIADASGGDVSRVLDELARRDLIRPIVTQGHIEDVLPDKMLFDAQTTSGGSGGPLFDQEGKVIGGILRRVTRFCRAELWNSDSFFAIAAEQLPTVNTMLSRSRKTR